MSERFWSKVDRSAGAGACWPWLGGRDKDGYGRFSHGRRTARAHRFAYELAHGPIPSGPNGRPLCVLHECDNPPCCNDSHLKLGTNAENVADRDAKGRQARGDRHWSRVRPERLARGDRHGARTKPESRTRGEQHWTRQSPDKCPRGDRNGARTKPETRARGDANGFRKYPERKLLGARNPAARLTEEIVRAIRAADGSQSAIARQFGLPRNTVRHVLMRDTWAHVALGAAFRSACAKVSTGPAVAKDMKETPIKTRQKGRATPARDRLVADLAAKFYTVLKADEGQTLKAIQLAAGLPNDPEWNEPAGSAMQLLKAQGQAFYVKSKRAFAGKPAARGGWRLGGAAPPADENPLRAPLLELARRAHRVVDEDPEAPDWDSLSAATAAAFAALGEAQPGSEDA